MSHVLCTVFLCLQNVSKMRPYKQCPLSHNVNTRGQMACASGTGPSAKLVGGIMVTSAFLVGILHASAPCRAGAMPATMPGDIFAHAGSPGSSSPAPLSSEPPGASPKIFLAWRRLGLPFNDLRNTLTDNWWGVRTALENHGLTPEVSLLQAASENFSGGIRTNRIDWRYRFDAGLELNTDKLFGWKGGTAFVDFMAHGGQNPQNDLVGALQAISAIDQNPATRLDQIWYKQELLDHRFWFKLGRIDTTYDFDNIRDAEPFLNGSFGFTPVIFVFPSYPFSAWGGDFSWRPIRDVTLRGGLFDGNTENTVPAIPSTNPYAIENPYGMLAQAEESLDWRVGTRRLGGTLTLGEWYHTGKFDTYQGTHVQGAHGFYGYLDQTLWKSSPAKARSDSRIGAFIQYAWANDRLTEIDQNLLGGLRWRGLIPGRPDDNTGIGFTWAHLSRYAQSPKNYELSIESFYSAQVTPWLNVQPDLQYIINPGGIYPNALVATIQVAISF